MLLTIVCLAILNAYPPFISYLNKAATLIKGGMLKKQLSKLQNDFSCKINNWGADL